MKNLVAVLMIPAVLVGMGACKEVEQPTTADIEGTYIGLMSMADSTFEQPLYRVTVEALVGSSLLITPSTSDATEWTTGVIITDGVFNCTNCTVNQLSIRKVAGVYQLSYTYQENEEFFGAKQ